MRLAQFLASFGGLQVVKRPTFPRLIAGLILLGLPSPMQLRCSLDAQFNRSSLSRTSK